MNPFRWASERLVEWLEHRDRVAELRDRLAAGETVPVASITREEAQAVIRSGHAWAAWGWTGEPVLVARTGHEPPVGSVGVSR